MSASRTRLGDIVTVTSMRPAPSYFTSSAAIADRCERKIVINWIWILECDAVLLVIYCTSRNIVKLEFPFACVQILSLMKLDNYLDRDAIKVYLIDVRSRKLVC